MDALPSHEFLPIGEMIANLRPPEWLVKGVLEADSLAVLYGEPGHGKSFIAMDIAACVATGRPWHSRPVKRGAVFYIAGEGKNGIALRFKAWTIKNETQLNASLFVSTVPVALDSQINAESVTRAIAASAERAGTVPVLIVVDTLARNFGGDENGTKDMNGFVCGMDRIRKGWGASVIIVHHTGKDISRGARGSSVLKAAVDAEFSVAMDELKIVALQAHKMKEAELPDLIAFRLEGVKLPMDDEDGNPIWSCAPVLVAGDYQPPKQGSRGRGKNQTLALNTLRGLYAEHQQRLKDANLDPETAHVQLEDWRNRCEVAGIDRKRFGEVKQSLLEHSKITISEPYVLVL